MNSVLDCDRLWPFSIIILAALAAGSPTTAAAESPATPPPPEGSCPVAVMALGSSWKAIWPWEKMRRWPRNEGWNHMIRHVNITAWTD